ncbi:MAG: hypothetical protein ACI85I_002774 [Arenicella sp.]|jgi:hypothetical protein
MTIQNRFYLLILLVFVGFQANSQDLVEKIEEGLVGQKWALTSYVQVEEMKQDTLFKVFDCQGEYIQFFLDNTFKDTNRDKKTDWEVSEDSIISYKKGFGATYKKSRIALMTETELVLIDKNKGGGIFYIENYRKCEGTETENRDTRTLMDISNTTSITVGAQYGEALSLGFGISRMKQEEGKKYAMYKNLELLTNIEDEIYGVSAGFLAQNVLIYGGGLSLYSDFDKYQANIQGTVGVTGKPLGGFGEQIQLFYTIAIPFIGQEDAENFVSTHNIGLRFNFAVDRSKKSVRKIDRDGTGY